MSRIRSIKPEWLEDESLLRAGSHARVLSVALILLADDYGRGRYVPEVMAAQVFPFEADPPEIFRESVASLSNIQFLTLYEVRGQGYFEVRNWSKHQKVDKPGKPRVPPKESSNLVVLETTRESRESSRQPRETLGPDLDHDHDHDHDHDQGSAEDFDHKPMVALFSDLRKAQRGGGSFSLQRSDYDRAFAAAGWCKRERPADPLGVARDSMRKFFALATGKEAAGWPFWAWANDPGRWLMLESSETKPGVAAVKAPAHRAYVPPT